MKLGRSVGYARVSTDDQNLDLQINALRSAGCDVIFQDQGLSGLALRRPGLEETLSSLSAGDVLVVWRLDRLGRSLLDLLGTIERLHVRKVGFRSLTETIDTTNATGRLMFQIMGALAEFERSLIAERTKAGLNAARERGVRLGRPSAITPEQIEAARVLCDQGVKQVQIASALGISSSTVSRIVCVKEGRTGLKSPRKEHSDAT
ncbi:MAG: recombinase family protein [Hyphomicrobium sp.]|uniref:recombinase family protein n=1 Tax=Hyphomicrobium sp. TaxID=82 RepID=UPI0025BE74C7|nr:recombinase family protein [Hyphomicrobium sp.]MBX9863083.1 recombinase family protein [Hyphomicrobium sp.]